ncbi:serine protease snake-like, partial [Hyposmocoma kahamanoa]|uniref:serine protease snake-like n=1 Tax=Hyposmocoma kahamanoa TaxID=1477025 RepID=UPI000E6D5F05
MSDMFRDRTSLNMCTWSLDGGRRGLLSSTARECKDYQKLFSSYFRNLWKDVITDCGRRTLLIGEAEKSPHMAVLGYGDRDHLCCVCAGTIISEKFILTAGVCTFSREDPLTHVLVGVFKRTDTRNATIYGIKRIINHPAYKWPIKYNDIALLELEVPLTLSKEIFPACLHIGDQVKDDEAYALSWSKTDFDSIVLQKISLSSSGECESIQYRHMPKGLDPNTQLCHAVDRNNFSVRNYSLFFIQCVDLQ